MNEALKPNCVYQFSSEQKYQYTSRPEQLLIVDMSTVRCEYSFSNLSERFIFCAYALLFYGGTYFDTQHKIHVISLPQSL